MESSVRERSAITLEGFVLGEALVWGTLCLAAVGVDTPRLDAECLLAFLFNSDRLSLYSRLTEPLTPDVRDRYRDLIARRENRMPVAYLTGVKEFWSLPLRVTPAVMIPRPETEILVEAALTHLRRMLRLHGTGRRRSSRSLLVADVGTGSGAIAIALARELPEIQCYATDISWEACEVAQENARAHGVAARITFLEGDLLQPLFARCLQGRLDLLISNPPYIPTSLLKLLSPEVQHEPRLALDGGPDGLAYHRRIIAEAPDLLRPGGSLLLEIDPEQAGPVTRLLQDHGAFADVATVPDLSGRNRVIIARCVGSGFMVHSSEMISTMNNTP